MIRIELEPHRQNYAPGSEISGFVIWESSKIPKKVFLTLEWTTYGKGSSDGEIWATQEWVPTSATGKEPFRWKLPRGPVSVQGQLLSIVWELTAETETPDEELTMDIVVSHFLNPIQLQKVDSQLLVKQGVAPNV